jgi:hypothetical protein
MGQTSQQIILFKADVVRRFSYLSEVQTPNTNQANRIKIENHFYTEKSLSRMKRNWFSFSYALIERKKTKHQNVSLVFGGMPIPQSTIHM